jgi:predicted nucleic acid-binding protein
MWGVAVERLKSLARWRVQSPLPDDVVTAADLLSRHRLSLWEAMIVRSAADLHCDTLWTEGLSDGLVIEGVALINPFTRQ